MNRCRACQLEYKARIEREKRRNDPEYRRRCVENTKLQREAKGHIYNANRNRKRSKAA